MGGNSDIELIDSNGKRVDGRSVDELRPLKITVGVIKSADGSAYVEWGKNKVICGVYGPKTCVPRHLANPNRAILKVKYAMATFCSPEEHGRAGPSRRSNEISMVIREIFENLVLTEKFPETEIDIFIDVLQASGGTRTASVTAASAALVNAGIPMKDVVSAVAVGKAGDKLMIDLGKEEDNFGQSDMPMAISRRDGNILLWQMDGILSRDELVEAINMAEKGVKMVQEKQDNAIYGYYNEDVKKTLINVVQDAKSRSSKKSDK